jgi:hypothetical protein
MPVRYSLESAGPSTRRNTRDEDVSLYYVDYKKMTKAELQQVAADLGLDTSGTKSALVARITR